MRKTLFFFSLLVFLGIAETADNTLTAYRHKNNPETDVTLISTESLDLPYPYDSDPRITFGNAMFDFASWDGMQCGNPDDQVLAYDDRIWSLTTGLIVGAAFFEDTASVGTGLFVGPYDSLLKADAASEGQTNRYIMNNAHSFHRLSDSIPANVYGFVPAFFGIRIDSGLIASKMFGPLDDKSITDNGSGTTAQGRVIPEPATVLLLGSGFVGLLGLTKRLRK